jgi:tellurite resistance protein TerC
MLATLFATAPWLTHIWDSMPVILSLIVIEGLLSVDNALAIAALSRHLEPEKRKLAMNIGYIGAYGFRIVALLIASWIIDNLWVKIIGALYLVWLMCAHFSDHHAKTDDSAETTPVLRTFANTVLVIMLMDLSLSVDNVVAAIALSPNNLTAVYIGVTIGIISLRIVADYAVKMIDRYPVLEHTAFLLVGYVGIMLLVEIGLHMHFPKEYKFIGIVAITALCIGYSEYPALHKVLNPLIKIGMLPMRLFSGIVGLFTWPFRKMFGKA